MLAMKQAVRLEETQSYAQPGIRGQQRRREEMSLHDRVSISAAILVSAIAVWSIATVGAKIDAVNYSVDHLQVAVQKAAAENASLTAQVDQLSQPSRILAIAGKLGMQYKNPVQVAAQTSQP